jgi:hypothetical protein
MAVDHDPPGGAGIACRGRHLSPQCARVDARALLSAHTAAHVRSSFRSRHPHPAPHRRRTPCCRTGHSASAAVGIWWPERKAVHARVGRPCGIRPGGRTRHTMQERLSAYICLGATLVGVGVSYGSRHSARAISEIEVPITPAVIADMDVLIAVVPATWTRFPLTCLRTYEHL